MEIGLVQLSQSVKTTNVMHTLTDTQTNYIMAPCTHPGMKRLFCLMAKNGLGRFAPSALPHYEEAFLPNGKKRPRSLRSFGLASLLVEMYMSQEVASYLQQAVCVRRKKKS